MTRHENLVAVLRSNGFRITPQRLAIAEVLATDASHPTVEQVHQQVTRQFPTTSLATVYKTMDTLKAVNEVHELDFSNGRRYGGTTMAAHAHLLCRHCGAVEDDELNLARLVKRAEQQTDYTVEEARADFYGLCARCR